MVTMTRPVVGVSDEDLEKPPPFDVERGSMHDYLSGLSAFGGSDQLVWDASEPEVSEIDAMLRADGKGKSLEGALTLPIRGAQWNIVPGEAEKAVVQFVTEAFKRPHADGGMLTPMTTLIGQWTGAFSFRRTYHEKIFTKVDWNGKPQTGYKNIAWRPHNTCTLRRDEKTGALLGFRQELVNQKETWRDFNLKQGCVYVHGQHRDPILGISEMDIPYRCWITKKKLEFIWYTYLESHALPKIIARTHGDEEAKKVARAIAALRSAGVVAIPDEWVAAIDTLDVSGQGAGSYREALEWCDHQAAISMLAGFTELGGQAAKGVGSYALSKDQTDFFLQMQLGFARELSSFVTEQVVADLVRYNFGKKQIVPKFEVGPLNPDDMQVSLDILKLIATASQVNLPDAFVNDLVMQVAKDLGMDLDKIAAAIVERKAQLTGQQSFSPPGAGNTTTPPPAGAEAMASVGAAADVGAAMIDQAQNVPVVDAPPKTVS